MNGDVVATLLFVLASSLVVWHAGESACQRKHDVHDCVWNWSIEPVEQEELTK